MTFTKTPPSPRNPVDSFWLAITFALTVGVVASLAAWASGDDPWSTMLTGGGAFGGALSLFLAVYRFAAPPPPSGV